MLKNAFCRFTFFLFFSLFCCISAFAQKNKATAKDIKTGLHLPIDTMVTTQHKTTINGQSISYTAVAGTQPVYGEDGHVIASLFYVYYTRDGIKDRSSRPLMISFNGGPGTGSVWMNIGFTGPQRLKIDDEGFPVEPYGVKNNPYSILDVADIVYVNPVNTGFSRIVDPKVNKKEFFGVNSDIKYLSNWVDKFVSRHHRWRSPKFLIGESYGTTRVSGLANALQNQQWMYLDGVILVSPTDLGIKREGPVKEASLLPYYTATAWYHKALNPSLQQEDLPGLLSKVEDFTLNKYIPALAKGGSISQTEKQQVAKQVAQYSGLPEKHVLNHNLIIPRNFFWKDLLRDKGYTIGRLDSRYIGIDQEKAGNHPDYNAELTSWLHSFTPAINYYLRKKLNFETDLKYEMFGNVWPWDNDQNHTGKQLSNALLSNPHMHLMVLSGYFDGACDYFNAKYSIWQINQSQKLSHRIEWHGFQSGHMMYLRKEDGKKAAQLIRDFLKKSIPQKGESIRYHIDQ